MSVGAYYNEIDPLKAEVLREAIRAGAIAPGDVDERSIGDVEPGDLVGYTQCHFFAGGGFWSLALRWAGWPDDRPVWTGSCPCPSFSAAGKGGGFDDPRHLWPHWDRLIDKSRPAVIFGEQADDAIGFGWLDLVQTDLEAKAYAVGSMVFGAHSVGAPHIRQRLYLVADDSQERRGQRSADTSGRDHGIGPARWSGPPVNSGAVIVGAAFREGLEGYERHGGERDQPGRQRTLTAGSAAAAGESGELAESTSHGRQHGAALFRVDGAGVGTGESWAESGADRSPSRTNPLNGFWRDADWIGCRDGKFRPVEPGTFPLAHGSAARVGRLRLYGDGIVVTQAQAFIESYCEAKDLLLMAVS